MPSNMHLLAYTIASAGGVTNQDVGGVTDFYATLINNHYILQDDWYIQFIYAAGVNMTDARVYTPYLASLSPTYAGNIDTAVTPTSLPGIDWISWPFTKIKAIDETQFQTTDAAVAGQLYGFLGLCRGQNRTIPPGQMFKARATAAITTGNKVWGQGSMTLTSNLPAGRYAVVGMDVVGANLLAARLFFPDGGPHPGVIARTSVANKPDPHFSGGNLGEFGQFESTAPPILEVFGNAAPTTQTVYLDLIQVRSGA